MDNSKLIKIFWYHKNFVHYLEIFILTFQKSFLMFESLVLQYKFSQFKLVNVSVDVDKGFEIDIL